jgi:hypothetical protein
MPHPAEARIRAPSAGDVYAAIKLAFPQATDEFIIAELARTIVFVAVSHNDVTEGHESADHVLEREVFRYCDELAAYFPWPEE